jgi:hypothetical protein
MVVPSSVYVVPVFKPSREGRGSDAVSAGLILEKPVWWVERSAQAD